MGLMGQEGKYSSQQGLLLPHMGCTWRKGKEGKREGRGGIQPPPFLFLFGVGREEGEGGILFPFSFPSSLFLLQFGQPTWEGRTGPLVAGAVPLLAH